MLLGLAGYSQAVSLDVLSPNIFDAIRRFQADMGVPVTGIVTAQQVERLRSMAAPLLSQWKLESTSHPDAGARLWIPRGLGLRTERTKYGVAYSSDQPIRIKFDYYSTIEIGEAYRLVLEETLRRSAVHYHIMRSDFFVVVSESGGVKRYVRYQDFRGRGIVGFELSYRPEAAFNGDRLSTIMSDLFRSSVGLGYAIFPPSGPRADPELSVKRTPESDKKPSFNTGTAFAVSTTGNFVTNAHVVDNCKSVLAVLDGQTSTARVIARDKINDLAVIATEFKPERFALIKNSSRLGEEVAVFGFPLLGDLASTGNFTRGSVTATAGLSNDTRQLQFQAPVQSGNSGGPLLDQYGNVIGVVTSKLDALKIASQSGEIPQNVNFAIKSSILLSFLDANGINVAAASNNAPPLSWPDVADRAKQFTALVICIGN
jgi:S1-C subfamily serine protease